MKTLADNIKKKRTLLSLLDKPEGEELTASANPDKEEFEPKTLRAAVGDTAQTLMETGTQKQDEVRELAKDPQAAETLAKRLATPSVESEPNPDEIQEVMKKAGYPRAAVLEYLKLKGK
jgi:hypothetical protein